MIFTNETLKVVPREFDWGTIFQVALGESGRGRKLLALTVPEEEKIITGLRKDLTISTTKSGKYRIIKKDDQAIYLLLSAEGGYTRRGNGYFSATKAEGIEVLARGNGADGEAGRIGRWDVALFKITVPYAVIRVRRGGAGYGTPSEFCVVNNGTVTYFDNPETYIDWADATGHEAVGIDDEQSLDVGAWVRL